MTEAKILGFPEMRKIFFAKYHFEIGLEEAGRIADTTYEIRGA